MPQKVLIVAYHFPPFRGSSGIQRTLKFATYLRDHGWEPMVLSASPRAYEGVTQDQMGEIPDGMRVERAFALDNKRHLSVKGRFLRGMAQPDRWVSWWPAGVWRGMQMIREQRPDVIMSTFPIATAHLIGLTLQRLSGLPWVADCRDSMTEPDYPTDPMTWRSNRRLERAVVRHCAKAVFTTPGAREMYAERYPQIPPSRWAVIENGFDEDNFRDASQGFEPRPLGAPGQLTLLHSGVLYPQERDPRPFFSALRTLKARGAISAGSLQVVLRATGNDGAYHAMRDEWGIADLVQVLPPISYREALQEMLCADALLLFQAANCNHQIPAKLYEYLRADRPILGLTDPAGNTADALRNAGATDIVDLADEHAIAAALPPFLAKLRDPACHGVEPAVAQLHSRRARSAELAHVLDEVAREHAESARVERPRTSKTR